jgi:hypothetical protein
MQKIIFLLTVFFFSLTSVAQQNTDKISVNFKDANIKTVIETIEKNSNYKFFFIEDWLVSSDKLISGTYTNADLNTILEDVLANSELNYFIDNNKVILTKNSIIYNKLPDNYFGDTISTTKPKVETVIEKPVFYKQYDTITPTTKASDKITIIGKQTLKSDKKNFVLSGYIKNLKTKEALANVFIKVQNTPKNTTTDESGFYSIELTPGVNYLETSYVNHKKSVRKVILYQDGTLNINLEENNNVLDEVVIDGKKNEKVKSAVSGVITIDIEGIKNIPLILGERDIFKVAATLPGIKTTGEGSAGYNVRGGKEDQNLILLDDGVIYNPAHFFGFFSAVNPYTTKSATIYKGSIPAEYGGRLSSVFDITSKNGNPTKFSGEGGIGPVTSNLALSTPVVKDKSSLLVGGRATYSGWILRSLKDEELKKSEASFYDGIIKYNHKFNDKNNFESTAYFSKDVFSISSDSLYKYSNRLVSLKYEHKFNEKNRGAIVFTNSEYKFNIDYNNETDNLKSFDFGYKINETQALLKLNYTFSEKHKFTYGVSSKLYGINPGFLDPKNPESSIRPVDIEKERGLESALFISDNFKVTKKLLVDVGLRYSNFSALGASTQRIYQENVPLNDASVVEVKNYNNNEVIRSYGGFEPRIAARYFLGKDFSIKVGYDKTFQYIHLLSSNTTQAPTDTWKLSDLNVKPQAGQQFSLGLFKNLLDKDLEFSIEGYYKKSRNFLDYKVAAQLLLNENTETELLQGEGKAYGIEFLIKKNSGRLNGYLGYTYSRTFIKLDSEFNDEKVNNGDYFPSNFDKPHDISLVLNYRFTKRYSMSSNFIYQTGRPITYPIGSYQYGNAQYTLYSDRNQFRIPDYYRLDIGFNVEGNHKLKKLAHGFWNISIYNVLGRNNPYSIYFVTDDGKIKAFKTSIFSIPVPTVTYNFKF